MARRRKGRYPNEFRRMAVEQLKRYENIVALSEELGVHRRLLYKWRDQLDPVDIGDEPLPENPRESTLRKEVSQLAKGFALDIPLNSNGCSNLTLQREQNSRCNVHNRLNYFGAEGLRPIKEVMGLNTRILARPSGLTPSTKRPRSACASATG